MHLAHPWSRKQRLRLLLATAGLVLFVSSVWFMSSRVGLILGMASSLRVVYVTVPSKAVATTIARSVVENKLAACVNIVPGVTSVYQWDGKVNEDEELLLIIKTQQSSLKALQESVTKLHPYDVPEFIALPVDHASEQYGKWVLDQTTK